jgi:hypothetical protein
MRCGTRLAKTTRTLKAGKVLRIQKSNCRYASLSTRVRRRRVLRTSPEVFSEVRVAPVQHPWSYRGVFCCLVL